MQPRRPFDSLQFLGTATTLIRFGAFTLLTDPNFLHRGDQVHIGYGLHATRRTDPALELDQLPPIDLVILSHFHEDHFDALVQQRLDHDLPILTTPDAAQALTSVGFRQSRALSTWQTWSFVKDDVRLRVTALPAQHTPLRIMQPLLPRVMGSLLEFSDVTDGSVLYRIYISGDTLLHPALREIPRRFPAIDLGLFHLGGTRIFGVMLTMDGTQGASAVGLIAPHVAVPVHYDDYDVFKSPLEDFRQAVGAAGLSETVRYVERGETIELSSLSPSPRRSV